MRLKLISIFVMSSGVLLAFTGFAKLISSLGTARILNSPDAYFISPLAAFFRWQQWLNFA